MASTVSLELVFAPAVEKARQDGRPIVALESTIITHGMPWPRNLETALAVEQDVRDHGAEPATIAIVEGRLHVGLDEAQLTALAKAEDVMKLSRADIAYALAQGKTGSTTVAATMIAARLADIDVFATGGIGGVHRGAETSFDVSADLSELAQTDVVVVCAGAKAILDLNKTLEVLETNGVPVIGYQCRELPAFWSRSSGLNAPLSADSPQELAQTVLMRREMGLEGGTLVANPVPEADEIPFETMARWIEQALSEAETQGLAGKEVTPALLARVVELSDGRSLETNVALIRNNARLAAEIAVCLAP